MPLTMKELDARLSRAEAALGADEELYARIAQLETWIAPSEPPEWVRPLIEALLGVRLGRAHEYAVSLQAKYYPTNLVDEVEVLPNG